MGRKLYYQYLSGEQHFQPGLPCVATELVAFRQRIGEEGMELILKKSIRVYEPPEDSGMVVSVDTTVQEKNITFHEPDVKCYSKGKEHKKYEFGSKAFILVDQGTGIIMGALNFTERLHNSKTLPEVLAQYEKLNGKQAQEVLVDRGYKGIRAYKESKIYVLVPDINITKEQRKKHSRRAAIEPVIGHLKQHYRLCRNYLKGCDLSCGSYEIQTSHEPLAFSGYQKLATQL